MKAVVYQAPFKLAIENVDDPAIEQPGDAVIRITTANICGSDLHPYEGRAPLEAGMVLGHETMGIVEETGPGVTRVKIGPGIGAVQPDAATAEAHPRDASAPDATLIADLSATTLCDMCGARALLTAHKQAAAPGLGSPSRPVLSAGW